MKVIQFAEYIQYQLRHVTEQLINMHNVFLCTLSRINGKPDTNHSTNPTNPNSGNPNPTNPTYPTNPTTKYHIRIWDRRLQDCLINCIVRRCIEQCWSQCDLFVVRELSIWFRELPSAIQSLAKYNSCTYKCISVTKWYNLQPVTVLYLIIVQLHLVRGSVPYFIRSLTVRIYCRAVSDFNSSSVISLAVSRYILVSCKTGSLTITWKEAITGKNQSNVNYVCREKTTSTNRTGNHFNWN